MIQPATATLVESERRPGRRTLIFCGIALTTASVIGLAGLQYVMPASFDNPAAVNHPGIVQFRSLMPMAQVAPMSDVAFAWTFRFLLAAAWTGYGLILVGAHRYGGRVGRSMLLIIGSVAALVAVVFPPSLSSDVYAYAGWGRMWVMHGWNPYVRTLRDLAEIGDPAGLIAPVAAPTTHGPIWIVIVCGVIGLLRNAGLWSQIVALKLLAGGAVLGAAVSGRAIARFYDSPRAELALLAIGFNPLFLIEGPGSGHNDVLMVALMLSGIALCLKDRPRIGYLLLGLSVGIKFVTAAIVPWLIAQQVLRQPRHTRLAAAALALGLVLTPALIGYAVFHVQRNGLDGIRAVYDHQTGGGRTTTTSAAGGGAPLTAAKPETPLSRFVVLLLVYCGLSVAVWRFAIPAVYLSCWAIFSMSLAIFGAPVIFAWYLVWPLSASLLRWDQFGLKINLACAPMAFFILLRYAVQYAR